MRIDSLELLRPKVELVRTRQGIWNFSTLGRDTARPAEGAANSSESAEKEFSLEKLRILDGQIGITDLQHNKPRTGYEHIDLTLLHYTAEKPFSFDFGAHVQGKGVQELRLKGEGGPVSASNPAETPFHGKLNLNSVGIDGLSKFFDMTTKWPNRLTCEGPRWMRKSWPLRRYLSLPELTAGRSTSIGSSNVMP